MCHSWVVFFNWMCCLGTSASSPPEKRESGGGGEEKAGGTFIRDFHSCLSLSLWLLLSRFPFICSFSGFIPDTRLPLSVRSVKRISFVSLQENMKKKRMELMEKDRRQREQVIALFSFRKAFPSCSSLSEKRVFQMFMLKAEQMKRCEKEKVSISGAICLFVCISNAVECTYLFIWFLFPLTWTITHEQLSLTG